MLLWVWATGVERALACPACLACLACPGCLACFLRLLCRSCSPLESATGPETLSGRKRVRWLSSRPPGRPFPSQSTGLKLPQDVHHFLWFGGGTERAIYFSLTVLCPGLSPWQAKYFTARNPARNPAHSPAHSPACPPSILQSSPALDSSQIQIRFQIQIQFNSDSKQIPFQIN